MIERRVGPLGVLFVLAVFVVVQNGCTAAGIRPRLSGGSVPKDRTPDRLTVAIVPSAEAPRIEAVAYDEGRGRAAAKRAGELGREGAIGGALLPFEMLFQETSDPLSAVVMIVLLPVLVPAFALGGAVIGTSAGAIGGAIKGDYQERPMHAVEAFEPFSSNLATLPPLGQQLAERFAATGNGITNNTYVLRPSIEPGDDFDVVLKLRITAIEFAAEMGSDPDIRFEMAVQVEITDADASIFFSESFSHRSGKISLFDWIERQGLPLREEFDACYGQFSRSVISALFISQEAFILHFLSSIDPSENLSAETLSK